MCLILIAYQVETKVPLVVAVNRDEYFDRPSAAAHFWLDQPEIFAGRDERDGGTWLGVNRAGKFAAIANREGRKTGNGDLRSRGLLVCDFLSQSLTVEEYLATINYERYAGFNLVVYDGCRLVVSSNIERETNELSSGYYAITNIGFHESTERSAAGLDRLSALRSRSDVKNSMAMLRAVKFNKSGRATQCQTYGTRSSTVVIFRQHALTFCEQQYHADGELGAYAQRNLTYIV